MYRKQFVRPPALSYIPKCTIVKSKRWGYFPSYNMGPIFFIYDIITKVVYVEILENTIFPWTEENIPLKWRCQQKNDPKNSTKLMTVDSNETEFMLCHGHFNHWIEIQLRSYGLK